MNDNDEDFSPITEEKANEAQITLDLYADARDKVLDTVKRLVCPDLTQKDADRCMAMVREALEDAYYEAEYDLHIQVREFEDTDTARHKRLERMGL